MPVTRASFLKTCGMAAAAPLVGLDWMQWPADDSQATTSLDAPLPVGDLNLDRFRGCLGGQFLIGHTADSTIVHLTEVVDGPANDRVAQYSLIFTSDAALREGTYRFRHAELGAFDLFIAPIGPQCRGDVRYQACISHMEKS